MSLLNLLQAILDLPPLPFKVVLGDGNATDQQIIDAEAEQAQYAEMPTASQRAFLKALDEMHINREPNYIPNEHLPAILANIKLSEQILQVIKYIHEEGPKSGEFGANEVLPALIELFREPLKTLSKEEKDNLGTNLEQKLVPGSSAEHDGYTVMLISTIAELTANPDQILDQSPQAQVETAKAKEIALKVQERLLLATLQEKCQQCRSGYEDQLRLMVVEEYVKEAKKNGAAIDSQTMETWLNKVKTGDPVPRLREKRGMERIIEQYQIICDLDNDLNKKDVPTKEKIQTFYKNYGNKYKKLDDSLGRRLYQSIKRILSVFTLKQQEAAVKALKNKLEKNPGRSFVKATLGFFNQQRKEQKQKAQEKSKKNSFELK